MIKLYDRILSLAKHPRAVRYLAVISFMDASILPLSPVLFLGPMILAKPQRAWRLAGVASLGSGLGALLGYAIGYYAFEPIAYPLLERFGYHNLLEDAIRWTQERGYLAIFLAGFSPIPYKIFTIGAGVTKLKVLPFLCTSLLGRSLRLVMVSQIMAFGGSRFDNWIRSHARKALGLGLLSAIAWVLLKHYR